MEKLKYIAPLGFEPLTVNAVTSRDTVYTISASEQCNLLYNLVIHSYRSLELNETV